MAATNYKFAFVMDPLHTLLVDKDTTFVMMLESQTRGHQIFYVSLKDMYSVGPRPLCRAFRCEVKRSVSHYQLLDDGVEMPLDAFDAIFMRKDPPADANYIYATMLLSLADSRRTFVMNHPEGLREANEKLYQLNFPSVIAPTLVTYEIPRLKRFMEEQGGEMVIKPLDGHGGEGVFVMTRGDRNLNAILETATHLETRPIMAQRYIPEVRKGDKRLIVLDGEPLGCTLRVPMAAEHRGNIHVGGTCVKAEVTARDREICRVLKPRLQRDGLYFVGLDVIGDFVTEVNVTSPTGIQEINRLDGVALEARVIDFVESRVAALPLANQH
ncbi:MAG TPA: glutathione synthase [Candidatus Binataceae bacterium]|nr:glutathione synthase [Candidatus Binataceae bacterium]